MDGDIGNMVSSVLSNPELLNKISDIVKGSKDGDISDALPKVVEAMSGSVESNGKSDEGPKENEKKWLDVSKLDKYTQTKNVALLRSLKPFMSKGRCDMIDNILKLEQMAEIIKLTR